MDHVFLLTLFNKFFLTFFDFFNFFLFFTFSFTNILATTSVAFFLISTALVSAEYSEELVAEMVSYPCSKNFVIRINITNQNSSAIICFFRSGITTASFNHTINTIFIRVVWRYK